MRGQTEPDIIPICLPAGDYYNFLNPWEQIMKPIKVSAGTVLEASLALGSTIVSEAMNQLLINRQAVKGFEDNNPTVMDIAGRLSTPVIQLLGILGMPDNPEKPARQWTTLQKLAVAGTFITAVIIVGALFAFRVI